MADLILHHYDASPFAHKARSMMGYKGLDWKSVEIPMVMPKPDLMPLTGGYRKTPVLQIGADIYCDTRRIAMELESRFADPTLHPSGEGLSEALTCWSDQNFFPAATTYVMGMIGDKLPPEFHADRAAMRGAEPPKMEALQKAMPRFRRATEQQLDWLENILSNRDYLTGAQPGLADLAVGHVPWFIANSGKRAAAVLDAYPNVRAWMDRIGAIGEGNREAMDAKDALAEAKSASPAPPGDSDVDTEADPPLGTPVSVIGEDRVPEAVEGELVTLSKREIAVRRDDEQVGEVVVHFPRFGYIARPAK